MVAIHEPPAEKYSWLTGSYGYQANGVKGYGVLRTVEASDGAWLIHDCWGDAIEADRVDELAGRHLA